MYVLDDVEKWRVYAVEEACRCARFCRNRRHVLDEAEGIAHEALLAALRDYDPNQSVQFVTYLKQKIAGEVRHFDRDMGNMIHIPAWQAVSKHATNTAPQVLSLDTLSKRREEPTALTQDGFEDEVLGKLTMQEHLEQINSLLPRLCPGQRETMRLLLQGKSINEIARLRRRHPDQISAQRTSAIRKLKKLVQSSCNHN